MFKNKANNGQDILIERLDRLEAHVAERFSRLEAHVEAQLGTLALADGSMDNRLKHVEAGLQACMHLREDILPLREEMASHMEKMHLFQQSEKEQNDIFTENIKQLSDAVSSLTQECSICASNSRVDTLQEELNVLSQSFKTSLEKEDAPSPDSGEESSHVQGFKDRLAQQGMQLERISNALSGNGDQLRAFMDEETLRQNNIRVEDATAAWLVRDIETWIGALPRGKFLESPPFAVEAPGVGRLDSLRLRFYPNGGPNACASGTCSLYLMHPAAMPWAQYELMVGHVRQGAFDPLFGGSDDFCPLGPQISEGLDGVDLVRLCVRFLPPGHRKAEASEAVKIGSSNLEISGIDFGQSSIGPTGPASWGEAPQATELWLSTNRLEST